MIQLLRNSVLFLLMALHVAAVAHPFWHTEGGYLQQYAQQQVTSHDCGDIELHLDIDGLHHCTICVRNGGLSLAPDTVQQCIVPDLDLVAYAPRFVSVSEPHEPAFPKRGPPPFIS